MRVVADFHLHSKYSRATSERLSLRGMAEAAKAKGVTLLGTGDFTHPQYFDELERGLRLHDSGFYEHGGTLFVVSGEVSTVWSVGGKAKKVHLILLVPSLDVAAQINDVLSKRGHLAADGRPTFGMSAAELVEVVMGIADDCEVIPAHAWTPWFSAFGSKSGFDSLKECFEDQAKRIHAIETGLSSDPPMNWRLSALDSITLVSNSDSHSPEKVGREANVFEFEEKGFSYRSLLSAIRAKDRRRFLATIEFYPEEGKYHFDGHRLCGVSLPPRKALACGNICPVCRRPLTIGVLHRVEELADRPEGFVPPNAIPFARRIPLNEILEKAVGSGRKAEEARSLLLQAFGNELAVLEGDRKRIEEVAGERVAEGIARAREGRVRLAPGYDGVYGEIDIFAEPAQGTPTLQRSLQEFL
ncbi:MAG: endonuclease Q family protein [Candidatus Micrarchaeia archaeon]